MDDKYQKLEDAYFSLLDAAEALNAAADTFPIDSEEGVALSLFIDDVDEMAREVNRMAQVVDEDDDE